MSKWTLTEYIATRHGNSERNVVVPLRPLNTERVSSNCVEWPQVAKALIDAGVLRLPKAVVLFGTAQDKYEVAVGFGVVEKEGNSYGPSRGAKWLQVEAYFTLPAGICTEHHIEQVLNQAQDVLCAAIDNALEWKRMQEVWELVDKQQRAAAPSAGPNVTSTLQRL